MKTVEVYNILGHIKNKKDVICLCCFLLRFVDSLTKVWQDGQRFDFLHEYFLQYNAYVKSIIQK